MAPVVYLLRSRSAAAPYTDALDTAGFDAVVLPVLTFEVVQTIKLALHLQRPDAFSGLVLTSPRAVAALAEQAPLLWGWKTKPTYCVGPATAARATALGLTTKGEDAGNGSIMRLAPIPVPGRRAGNRPP